MKKILYTLVALAFSSATFAQPYVTKTEDFYPGAIFNEKSLKSAEPKLLAHTTEKITYSSGNPFIVFEMTDFSKEAWEKKLLEIYPNMSEGTQLESFKFNTPNKIENLKLIDKAYNTYNAIKDYYNIEQKSSKNIFFGRTEVIAYSLDQDLPGSHISKTELDKIKDQDPIVLIGISFGKKADILIESNQSQQQINSAFNIYKDKNTSRYNEAREILADASVHILFFGKNPIDTSDLTNEELILAYIKFITSPLTKEDYLYPIKYNGAHLNNRVYYQSDISKDSYI
ncbi:hypothetical protein HX025_09695 [Myroides odoratimimus]|uniref:hypothetical protein n=1 Tax=Myroides odoratimimus TaxID=76832 RepID=UPI0025781D46|nr:hypothetical protein [Myroides odoratimimus]MDM1456917.1 hypothetical protein [Myroides odoratimimus]